MKSLISWRNIRSGKDERDKDRLELCKFVIQAFLSLQLYNQILLGDKGRGMMHATKRTEKSLGSKLVLSLIGGILLSFLCYLPNANACTITNWEVLSNTINYLNLGPDKNYTIMLSADSTASSDDIAVTGYSSGGSLIYTNYPAANVTLTNTASETITLSGQDYYLYVLDGDNNCIDYTVVDLNYGMYELVSGDVVFAQIDARPVPIPPSALLLGSGMIGLIGFGVRRRRSNKGIAYL